MSASPSSSSKHANNHEGSGDYPGNAYPRVDDIVRQENAIRREIAQEQELIGELKSTLWLIQMFQDDPIRSAKCTQLHARFQGMRRVRGDGDCFFRAMSFAYLGPLVCCPESLDAFKTSAKSKFNEAGYDAFAYECFLEDLNPLIGTGGTDLRAAWAANEYAANAVVMIMRLLAAAHLKINRDRLEVYAEEGTYDAVIQAASCLSTDADHLVIMALAEALHVNLIIAYLDGHPGDLNYHEFGDVEGPHIALLYRPGHYDLLYPQETA